MLFLTLRILAVFVCGLFTSELGKPFPCWSLLSDHVWCGHFSPNASKDLLMLGPDCLKHSRFSSGVKQGLGETSPAHLPQTHLHKQGDGVESEDLHAVHGIPGKDVQGSSAAFHNLLHPHTVLHEKSHWGIATVSLGSGHPLPGHWQTSLVLGVCLSGNLPP